MTLVICRRFGGLEMKSMRPKDFITVDTPKELVNALIARKKGSPNFRIRGLFQFAAKGRPSWL
jgi:hypothetical protein